MISWMSHFIFESFFHTRSTGWLPFQGHFFLLLLLFSKNQYFCYVLSIVLPVKLSVDSVNREETEVLF